MRGIFEGGLRWLEMEDSRDREARMKERDAQCAKHARWNVYGSEFVEQWGLTGRNVAEQAVNVRREPMRYHLY